MRNLLLQYGVVTAGQGQQIAASAKREQRGEAHAEHEEHRDGGAGQAARRVRTLLPQTLLDGQKFGEDPARLVELGFAAPIGDRVGDVLMFALEIDHLLRVRIPAGLDGLNAL
ncbi:hypothetical protein LMG29739_03489 [Paraburkholderia solisilvae]|uniref:Uncharacterized protein n=1 Tax=Paraburkholderia solisilvae TaxID=624376 RepID=A0A6J5E6F4_9BURK|nr:hypothetical protein LMG29739_03489 [Paraburkholderia solisilvae]